MLYWKPEKNLLQKAKVVSIITFLMIKFPDLNIALTCPLGGIIFTLFRSSSQNVAKHVVRSHYLQKYCRGP
jgi:hypothetical protein